MAEDTGFINTCGKCVNCPPLISSSQCTGLKWVPNLKGIGSQIISDSGEVTKVDADIAQDTSSISGNPEDDRIPGPLLRLAKDIVNRRSEQ